MAETKRLTVPDAEEMLGKELKVLDKGFVRLVSYDGSDQAILEAARCSYQGLDQKVHTPEQDAALIDFLMRYRHCYDSETEALVLGRGFIKWPLIKATDKLGIWDDKNGTIKYEVPNYLTEEDYNGQMYKVDHGGIDLLVTPEHRMFVKTKKWNGTNTVWDKKYELISANTLSHKSMVRYKKTAPSYNRNVPPSDWPLYNEDEQAALWSFFGFFVGDGYVSSRNTISFHLKRQRKIDYLRSLCKRLGWEIRTLENNNYSIYQNEIGNRFNRLFYTLERKKTMPTFMQFSSSEESLYILEGLKNSDGSIKRGTWQYSTAVEELAHQVQLVGLHAGEAAHVYRNKSYMWTVMFLSRMKEPVVNQGSINTAWVNYRGKVYCAHTSTGVLVVRRNNKIVLSGNSSPFEMVTLKFHMKMPIFVARQIIRHRTASVNEYSGRYAEMKEEFYVPEKGNIRLQSKTNKQQSGEVAKDSIQDWTIKSIEENNLECYDRYAQILAEGVSREMSRIQLPLNIYTEWYWQQNLHNLLHLCKLRLDEHAQLETRQYAQAIEKCVIAVAPLAHKSWVNAVRDSVSLTKTEAAMLGHFLECAKLNYGDPADSGYLTEPNKRKQDEYKAKLDKILNLA